MANDCGLISQNDLTQDSNQVRLLCGVYDFKIETDLLLFTLG